MTTKTGTTKKTLKKKQWRLRKVIGISYDQEMFNLYGEMVIERHKIWLARQQGLPQPWTEDPVLKNRKFTNMFRVLDPGSQFVFDLQADDPMDVLARLVFYRLTNKPSTWHAIQTEMGCFPLAADFIVPTELLDILKSYRAAGNRIFSGAYIIVPEPGTANDKVEGAIRVVQHFLSHHVKPFLLADTQAHRFITLKSTPGLGPFLSMQILTDWTYLQSDEPYLPFVVAGPGARRGAALLAGTGHPEEVIADMTMRWRGHPLVNLEGRSLTPMDVQNTFCEFSKYAREIVTPRKITPYKPANPGIQPKPRVPAWW
jgi:hypothetical protein